MPHDKIKAAARKRMAESGEPYTAARRAVSAEHQPAGGQPSPPGARQPLSSGAQWFAISYSRTWSGRVSGWLDRVLFRAGPGVSGVEVDSSQVRVRMGSFKLDIPRGSVRSARRSQARVGGTIGVHGGRGRWLVNGSADGLVELAIDPPCYLDPGIDTLFRPQKVNVLTVSLVDPGGFVAALEQDPPGQPA